MILASDEVEEAVDALESASGVAESPVPATMVCVTWKETTFGSLVG